MSALPKSERQYRRKNEEKWTKTLLEPGWIVIPAIFLQRQKALNLDAIDINIILHLAMYWWEKDKPPFPSKQAIADCMQIDVSTVRRRIADMEKEGLIERRYRSDPVNGQKTNEYILEGLIKAATPLAQEATEARKKKKKDGDDRRKSKKARPPMSVVKSNED